MVIVIGKIRARPGSEETVARAASLVTTQTAGEDGVLEYSFFRDKTDSRLFTILEVWADAEALAAHSASEHLAEFRGAVYPVLELRDVKIYDATQRVPQ